jgi:hypothetical protein
MQKVLLEELDRSGSEVGPVWLDVPQTVIAAVEDEILRLDALSLQLLNQRMSVADRDKEISGPVSGQHRRIA